MHYKFRGPHHPEITGKGEIHCIVLPVEEEGELTLELGDQDLGLLCILLGSVLEANPRLVALCDQVQAGLEEEIGE